VALPLKTNFHFSISFKKLEDSIMIKTIARQLTIKEQGIIKHHSEKDRIISKNTSLNRTHALDQKERKYKEKFRKQLDGLLNHPWRKV